MNELNTHMQNWTNLSLFEKKSNLEKHFRQSMWEEKHFGEMSERLSIAVISEKKVSK